MSGPEAHAQSGYSLETAQAFALKQCEINERTTQTLIEQGILIVPLRKRIEELEKLVASAS